MKGDDDPGANSVALDFRSDISNTPGMMAPWQLPAGYGAPWDAHGVMTGVPHDANVVFAQNVNPSGGVGIAGHSLQTAQQPAFGAPGFQPVHAPMPQPVAALAAMQQPALPPMQQPAQPPQLPPMQQPAPVMPPMQQPAPAPAMQPMPLVPAGLQQAMPQHPQHGFPLAASMQPEGIPGIGLSKSEIEPVRLPAAIENLCNNNGAISLKPVADLRIPAPAAAVNGALQQDEIRKICSEFIHQELKELKNAQLNKRLTALEQKAATHANESRQMQNQIKKLDSLKKTFDNARIVVENEVDLKKEYMKKTLGK